VSDYDKLLAIAGLIGQFLSVVFYFVSIVWFAICIAVCAHVLFGCIRNHNAYLRIKKSLRR